MLLRYIAIALLVLIVLRLLSRATTVLANALRERPADPVSRDRLSRREPPRRLEACRQCGTYFDPQAGAGSGHGDRSFCSTACREATARAGTAQARKTSRAASRRDAT